ncbi:ATP phosphoribosyltransferase regulatory subunit [Mesosutterella sp. AGMB02718]|uniref:ATP phosphoribosyltransferase regulatory subunit n=1 Tax=Mesosutterella faecium TaxID=2925194 RepID=A0ABT7ILL0_9BURK|nr:ATP phosphoribosyltransferase regulatory subunit [Mesosutterella sp. AGMB02718]MDL2059243.1 ATP phosphoribosyltransferase regulatory subunit [Mesosutterella sp. AGMB02718]
MTNWLLPDHISDMLPRQARELERLRALTLGIMRSHGFEVIRPPMFEFLDSLLTGSGNRLERSTIKFVDESSGRLAGFRADITPQVARIDAHILNRPGITRLCYAGSVLHAKPRHPLATRQPYVVGAEMFGATGRESDLEMVKLASEVLRRIGVPRVHLVLGHTGIVRAVLKSDPALSAEAQRQIVSALGDKDPSELASASEGLAESTRRALASLCLIYGGTESLAEIESVCAGFPEALEAVRELRWLTERCGADEVTVDGSSVTGFDYYTGVSFAGILEDLPEPILRGGRYDGIGLAFGRYRPAVGFTIYMREYAALHDAELPEATTAPASEDPALGSLIERIREQGGIVVQLLPGEQPQGLSESFRLTHRIVFEDGRWTVKGTAAGTD